AFGDLVPGEMGILTSHGPDVSRDVRICLVPGLAFTHEGHRLGYGGGFYDRFLTEHPLARPIGLCFERQMVPKVPVQNHDVAMTAVITDCGVHDPTKVLKTLRVVAGAVVRNGRVLTARRGPGMLLAGCWELPGGKVEPGEDDRDALARELFEELGIRVKVTDAIGDWEHPYPTARVHLIAYVAELVEGEPKTTEHDAIAWIEVRDLPAMGWAPADVPLIQPLIDWLNDAE
ncbi:MAG: NUDIX domain-containing protein, partial [Rhodobacterales bacterium]|nr:NUDIX domain-containing protein [Rhodobacterales bacterium]